MNVVLALAAVLAAPGAASAQVMRLPASTPRLSPPAIAAPLLLAAPSAAVTPLIASLPPAPGAAPAPVEAAKAVSAAAVRAGAAAAPVGAAAPAQVPDLFDGRAARPATDSVELGALRRYAAPWRTDAQLAKLAATSRPAGEAFRFAVIGDAEPGRFWFSRRLFNSPGVFWKLLARADRSRPDFILQLGDMVSRGTAANFKAFFGGLFASGARTPYLTALGNHDRRKPHGITDDKVYRASFGSPDYAFDRGGRRFIVLDSSAGRVTPAQLAWLGGLLNPEVPTVVFTHIPPAPLSEWTDWGRLKGAGGFKEGSAEFMRLMSLNKVQRVYMGHIHGLGVLERGGVKYVLTGGGGSPLFPGPVKRRLHHWLSVEAGPDGLVETVHAADGSSFPLP